MFIPGIVASMVAPAAASGQQTVTLDSVTSTRDVATDGNGNWIIVGVGGADYSTDKINWTGTAFSFPSAPRTVASDGAGNWVIADINGGVYTSTDNGVNWTARTTAAGASTLYVTYHAGPDKFYVTGPGTDHQVSADSGVTWSSMAIPNSDYIISVSNGARMVIAGDSGYSKYTDDGVTWTNAGLPLQGMEYGEYATGTFAIVNTSGLYNHGTTGSSWTINVDIDGAIGIKHSLIFYIENESRWITGNINGEWYESTNIPGAWTKILSGDFFGTPFGVEVARDATGYVMLCGDLTTVITKTFP